MSKVTPEIIKHRIDGTLKGLFESRNLPLYDMMSYHFGLHEDSLSKHASLLHGSTLLLSVDAFGGKVENALPASVAVELVNGFCEIHDDVESGRPQRSERDALWWIWGPAQAINAGDGMHALARISVLQLTENGFSSELTYSAISLLDRASLLACEGRFRDLEMQERVEVSLDSYTRMASDRSGALFGASLSIAALLSGLDELDQEKLTQCGKWIGESRQIRSDMEELWSSESGQNLEFLNKKKLFPVVAAMRNASPNEKRRLGEVYFKRVLELEDLKPVRDVVEGLGGREESEERIKHCEENCRTVFDEICKDAGGGDQLLDFLTDITR